MSLSAIIFQSAEKKHSGLKVLSPLLVFSILLSFLALAIKIVKTKPLFPSTSNQVLSFGELLPSPKPYPINKETYFLPELTAESVIIVDVDSAVVLYQKNADLKLLPASTTKMMTATVVIDNYSLDKVLTVGNTKVDGNTIKLIPGEKIIVENLLYGLLVGSGNDAAQVLAENFPGGIEAFVSAMNQKVADLRLENTHFTNPMGLDEGNHYSTARDLARLATKVVGDPILAKIVSTPEITITDISGEVKHSLKNTNELVGKIEGVKGVKTGWTQNAGECLVAWVEKEGKKIVIVVLESKNRFEETRSLIDWAFNNFEWKTIVPTSYP